MPELQYIDVEQICFVIFKARQFQAKQEAAGLEEGSNPADDDSVDVLEDSADDAVYDELITFLRTLEEDEVAELLTIAWLGRGDYHLDDWEAALADAGDDIDATTPEHMLEMPLLAGFLHDGLAQLGHSCEAYEKKYL